LRRLGAALHRPWWLAAAGVTLLVLALATRSPGAGPLSLAIAAALGGMALGGALVAAATGQGPRPVDNTRARGPAEPAGHGGSPTATPGPLGPVLRELGAVVDARRVVLWRVDGDSGAVVPLASSGDLPPPVTGPGEPLAWCAEQGQPLRLVPLPIWAVSPVTAVPVPGGPVPMALTIEAGDALDPEAPAPRALGALAGHLIRLRDEAIRVTGQMERIREVLAFVRGLPAAADAAAFTEALARTATELAGQDGAVIVVWQGDEGGTGEVLAAWGDGDGPGTGAAVEPGSMVAMAMRADATLHREPASGQPLVTADERWRRRGRSRTVIPLTDGAGRRAGAIALWGDAIVEADALTLLDGLRPALAAQLTHALDLDRARERLDRDPLTGLADRGALEDRLELEGLRYSRYRRPLALMVLDLDHFKTINDTHGHPAGDAVLRHAAEVVRVNTREPDLPARFGGEEMVVVLPETMLRQAVEVAERVRAALETAVVHHEGVAIRMSASIGVSACPECVDDPRHLLRSADEALYEAKRAGRNRVVPAPPDPDRGLS
jgi:diguanylate cyclase (GGDEF)-like protein